MAFKEPVYKILECIKNEPYFRWVGKMGGDLARRNQSLYCTYHWEKRHTTEQCRVLKDHLKQLVKVGHLKEFIVGQEGGNIGQGSGSWNNQALPPPIGIIEVIHATIWGVSLNNRKGMLSMVSSYESETLDWPKKKPRVTDIPISFSEFDLEGTSQSHGDALVMTFWIGGFLVKRVMVD